MLNPIQIVALNVLVTAGLFAVLLIAGMAWLPAMLWAWIGGGVVTLYCAVTLVVVFERRDRTITDMQGDPHRRRKNEIASWEEDALDEAWDVASRQAKARFDPSVRARVSAKIRKNSGI